MAVRIKPEEKMPKTYDGKEKYILRKAFDTPDNPYLPDEVLWRQKEQFSDGVGYNWIDQLIEYCSSQVTDDQLAGAEAEFPYNTPTTLSLIHISEPTRPCGTSRMPSSA